MINTIELAITQKLLKALEVYKLSASEAGASVRLITTLGGGNNAFHSDGVAVDIGARRITDQQRQKEVDMIIRAFVEDFVQAVGIDRTSKSCSEGCEAHGGYMFSCENIAVSSLKEGANRAVDDVLNGLDRMIAVKLLGHSL